VDRTLAFIEKKQLVIHDVTQFSNTSILSFIVALGSRKSVPYWSVCIIIAFTILRSLYGVSQPRREDSLLILSKAACARVTLFA